MRVVTLLVCTLILASCGGGGGETGGTPPPAQAAAFTLNPTTVTATFQAGTSATITVTATPTTPLTGTIYATIVDHDGVLSPQVTFTPTGGNQSYNVGLTTSSSLKTGHYTGTFQVNVCYDANCAQAVAGSPVSVPYDFTVTSPPSGSTPPPSGPLTFNPTTISATFTAGDPAPSTITVGAISSIPVSSTLTVVAHDPDGRILSDVIVGRAAAGSSAAFSLILPVNSSLLQAGIYNGSVQLTACLDQACTQPVSGTPVTVPYQIQITPKPANAGLTPLTPWSGVSDWQTYQHDIGHTGFVPVTLDPSVFATRWLWTGPGTYDYADAPPASTLTVSGGQVYVNSNWVTYALEESDSTVVWQHDFKGILEYPMATLPNPAILNPPATSGGNVYIATSGQQGTFMFGLKGADGSMLFQTPFLSQFDYYLAPTVDGGTVFNDGGYYGGMVAFDATAGTSIFANTTLPQFDKWTPTVDANYAYAYLGYHTVATPAGLYILDRNTGVEAGRVVDPDFGGGDIDMNGAVVLGQPGSVFAVNLSNAPQVNFVIPKDNNLVNFDTNAKTVRWRVSGKYQGNPAYAAGVLYAINASPLRLEAHSETDGSLLWSWAPQLNTETGFLGDVLVTNNLVFVSTNVATYAISQSTHQVVWSKPNPGWLALSANGVLYIVLAWEGNSITTSQVLAINVKN